MPSGADRRAYGRVLQLLSFTITLSGGVFILISAILDDGIWHDLMLGLGSSLIPTGIFSILYAHYVDELSRHLIRDVIAQQIEHNLEERHTLLDDAGRTGLQRIFNTREDALEDIAARIDDELGPADQDGRRGRPKEIWFLGTSLHGFFYPSHQSFHPQGLVKRAAMRASEERGKEHGLTLRFLLLHPQSAHLREDLEHRNRDDVKREIEGRIRELLDLGVEPAQIRLYRHSPTAFVVATSRYLWLNPYPHHTQAHRNFLVKFCETEGLTDGYSQYYRGHLEATWKVADELSHELVEAIRKATVRKAPSTRRSRSV